MSTRTFSATVSRDPEVGGFVAQCVGIDVASQGESVEEALANLREALELYFEVTGAPATTPEVLLAQVEVEIPVAS
ncbi:MAG: type II toxin-antitoxin system HicB family antitoxin [Alphaproteobacteria bacterium]|nr:type II toxin-antitoxin system HicB family antitoxin [Alphaproteobacteria bacterium]